MLSCAWRNEIWQHLITSLGWFLVLKELVLFVVAANSTDYPNHSFKLEWPLIIDYRRQETKLLALHRGCTAHLCMREICAVCTSLRTRGNFFPPLLLPVNSAWRVATWIIYLLAFAIRGLKEGWRECDASHPLRSMTIVLAQLSWGSLFIYSFLSGLEFKGGRRRKGVFCSTRFLRIKNK